MNKTFTVFIIIILLTCCNRTNNTVKRIPVAKAGDVVLYYDEIPAVITDGITRSDSLAIIHSYINRWGKSELLFKKAEENLSAVILKEIEKQVEKTRFDLVTHEYQRQMILEKMDTLVTDEELESYYAANENSFILTSNIVKALFIKLPVETPDLNRIRLLARSSDQKDIQVLETLCHQFAEKFDDFAEKWITMDRLSFELKEEIANQESFLRRSTFYETSDSVSVFLITINDYRLRGARSPFEYVRNDIKRIIWNYRRIDFLKKLENGIYNDALRENVFKIF